MHVNRERRQAWAEQSEVNLERHGPISKDVKSPCIVEGSLLIFTERHVHGLHRCATVSSVSPYSNGTVVYVIGGVYAGQV